MKGIIFCLIFVLYFNTSSNACVCDDWAFFPKLTEKHLQDSTLSFVTAKVLKIKAVRYSLFSKGKYNKVKIQIIESYDKSIKKKSFSIMTGLFHGGDCGFPFKLSNEYFIILRKKSTFTDLHSTSICYPTHLLSNANEHIDLIRKYYESKK